MGTIDRIKNDLPWKAMLKGLFMTIMLSFFSERNNDLIFYSALAVVFCTRQYSINFYIFFAIFWPMMEIIIIHLSNGNAWIYKHADFYNIPRYIFPLWAIVSECVIDIHSWGIRMQFW